jgi:aspartyl-tRNA(Asn)/glutamyl-tRNA(Gln) amidotransferase subunit A
MMHQQSYGQLRARYGRGQLSPVDVAESALAHAASADRELNAFALIDRERALAAARQSEVRWRRGEQKSAIDGMPVSIKEFAAVRGWPTRRGSVVTPSTPAASSAVFVQRIEDAGGVLIAKTRAPEFNWKGVTDSVGHGITRNPWDLCLTPGGSSGGCAAAVAAGVVRVSMGSDAGGSVRIPAAFTGTVALKPTFGRIPVTPLPSAFHNVVHIGPVAASVAELADMMSVVAGASIHDWTSAGLENRTTQGAASKLRIGLVSPSRWSDSVRAVKDGMHEVLDLMSNGGFEIEEVDFDVRGASATGTYLYRQGCLAVLDTLATQDLARIDQEFIRFARMGEGATVQQLAEILRQRDQFANHLSELFGRVDVLVLPTMPIVAFDAGRNVPAGWHDLDWMSWNPYTPAFNATQVPALSFPVWPKGSQLPVGIQLVAGPAREDRLLHLATWLEALLPIRLATSSISQQE